MLLRLHTRHHPLTMPLPARPHPAHVRTTTGTRAAKAQEKVADRPVTEGTIIVVIEGNTASVVHLGYGTLSTLQPPP
jgi:hypothetical protein